MTTHTRPKPIEIGPLRASPTDRYREERGVFRWYWRARRKGVRDLLWSGWATREQTQVILADKVTRGPPAPASNVAHGPVATVGDLLDRWMARQRARADLAPKTVDHYDKAARHFVARACEVDVGQLDWDTVERYRDDRHRERASPIAPGSVAASASARTLAL
jgi:hypothetical protein